MLILLVQLARITLSRRIFNESVNSSVNCRNPIFREENWDYTQGMRPVYLNSPQKINPSEMRFCFGVLSSDLMSCCDKNTISSIYSLFKLHKSYLQKTVDFFIGAIRDTFNDFDPENQKDYGREFDEKGNYLERCNKNNSYSIPGQNYLSKGKLKEWKEQDKALAEKGRGRPMNRGIRRFRPQVFELSRSSQQALANYTRSVNSYMLDLAAKASVCLTGIMKHLAGILSFSCTPHWQAFFANATTLILKNDVCQELQKGCVEFLENLETLQEKVNRSKEAIVREVGQKVDLEDLELLTLPPAKFCKGECSSFVCNFWVEGSNGVTPYSSFFEHIETVDTLKHSSVAYKYSKEGYDSYSVGEKSGFGTAVTVDGQTSYISLGRSLVFGTVLGLLGII